MMSSSAMERFEWIEGDVAASISYFQASRTAKQSRLGNKLHKQRLPRATPTTTRVGQRGPSLHPLSSADRPEG
jgi:hypothetical protein